MIPYSLKRTTDPTVEPITLSELKSALRVDGSDDDTELTNLIVVGRQAVERDTALSLLTQTWTLKLDMWPRRELLLLQPPVQSVTSITYIDSAGTTQTWSSSRYIVHTSDRPGMVTLAYSESWPTLRGDERGITVTYVTGFGNAAASVPYELRQAVILYAQAQYDGNCEQVLRAYERIVSANRVGVYP